MADEEIVSRWIRYQVRFENDGDPGPYDPDFEGLEALWDLISDDPNRAFSVLEKIVASTDDEKVLGMVGAGPLEDLLQTDSGPHIASAVMEYANKDERWRLAFGHVWTHGFKNRGLAAVLETSLTSLYPDGRL